MAIKAPLRYAICLLALAAILGVGCRKPAKAPNQHASVELVSRQSGVVPGTDLPLGIHFMLDPGWHIYWINSGDSGQPPSFKWQLPDGFSAGEIEWPRPERMQPSKELTDYGYHNDVLLPVKLHIPASIAGSASVEIAADAKWLICREVCLPERSQLRLTLPRATSATANQQSAALFARTDELLPQPVPIKWKATATAAKEQFTLTISAGSRITKAEFFPLDTGVIDNPAPQQLQSTSTGARLTLKKSDLLVKPVFVLRGLLVIPGGPAYRIEAPVRQPIQ